ncbi:MAG: hypothetical protein ACI9XC_002583 [Gammaproteobacteria bacterium]|jgi:hypothetical protein
MFSVVVNAARMYQWIDPDTSTTQLSGKPPHWYRSAESGPRVVVYDNGRVIDDTGIELSPEENDRQRQQALIIVERDRTAAKEKLASALRQKAVFDTESDNEEEVVPVNLRPMPEEVLLEELVEEEADIANTAQKMKELLEQFETLKTQNAKELVEAATP